jgi:hypothetical protein
LAACLLAGAGCQRLTDQKAAIQEAIEDHLSERDDLAMDQMVLEMGEVKVEGDSAEAEVVFRTTSEPAMRMAYHYELRREGGRWQVASGRPSAAEVPHPTLGETGGESESSVEPALPEGHPAIPESSSPLPEGHPPTGEPPPQP